MNVMALESAFCPCFFYSWFQNAGIIRVHVLVSGFSMLFLIPRSRRYHSFQASVQEPETFNFFYSFNVCKCARSAPHFVYNYFELFFYRPVLRFLNKWMWKTSAPSLLMHVCKSSTYRSHRFGLTGDVSNAFPSTSCISSSAIIALTGDFMEHPIPEV